MCVCMRVCVQSYMYCDSKYCPDNSTILYIMNFTNPKMMIGGIDLRDWILASCVCFFFSAIS